MALDETLFAVVWFQLLECVPAAVLYPVTVGVFVLPTIFGLVILHVVPWAVPL